MEHPLTIKAAALRRASTDAWTHYQAVPEHQRDPALREEARRLSDQFTAAVDECSAAGVVG